MGDTRIDCALEWFDKGEYDRCVEQLIQCYDEGIEKKGILDFFKQNFIEPNDAEFRANYSINAKEMTRKTYEDCLIDFIPVSDEKYYLFYKPEKKFLGSFVMEKLPCHEEMEFHGLLIADTWDFRAMLPFISEKEYKNIYIVLGEYEPLFISYFKLPGFTDKYLSGAIIFDSVDLMKMLFMENPSFYLPHYICAVNRDYYNELIREIRKKRIANVKSKREDPFVSIYIPSYNRGHRALDAVRCLQNLEYDSEVEIIVSDNGSIEYTEGYEEIAEIAKRDSRVRYIRNSENIGAPRNFLNALKYSKGYFVMCAADEDYMELKNVEWCFNYLFNHMKCGSGEFLSLGPGASERQSAVHSSVFEKTAYAYNCTYLTGVVINNIAARQTGVYDTVDKYIDTNSFVRTYTHCAMLAMAALRQDYFIDDHILWIEGTNEKDNRGTNHVPPYAHYENRTEQAIDAIIFAINELNAFGADLVYIIRERLLKTYALIDVVFKVYERECLEHFSWVESCCYINKGFKEYIKSINVLDAPLIQSLLEYCDTAFWEKLELDSSFDFLTEKEVEKRSRIIGVLRYIADRGHDPVSLDYSEIESIAGKSTDDKDMKRLIDHKFNDV